MLLDCSLLVSFSVCIFLFPSRNFLKILPCNECVKVGDGRGSQEELTMKDVGGRRQGMMWRSAWMWTETCCWPTTSWTATVVWESWRGGPVHSAKLWMMPGAGQGRQSLWPAHRPTWSSRMLVGSQHFVKMDLVLLVSERQPVTLVTDP